MSSTDVIVNNDSAVYGSSRTKGKRSTVAELAEVKKAIYGIAETNQPCSTRQIYYVGIGVLWEKDQGRSRATYQRVNRYVGEMREAGEMPWAWITDSTRLCRIPTMYDSHEEALAHTAEFYRRNLWSHQPRHVEIWCESDSVGAMLQPVTRKLGVGLYACRGQSGKGFIYESVQQWVRTDKPITVLYVGDWDPSGVAIPRSVHERQMRYSGGAVDLDFRRIAVTWDDVTSGRFTSHAVNTQDKNVGRFTEECRDHDVDPTLAIEVEAIPAPMLRNRVETEIYDLVIDADTWNATLEAEDSERELLYALVNGEVIH